jgi:triosephosphate isomerase
MSLYRPLIVGNWKMYGLAAQLAEAVQIAQSLTTEPSVARVGLCPPATLIERMVQAVAGSPLIVGGQDNHAEAEGAFTGDVSSPMLIDAGAKMVIIAHSERRGWYGESDSLASSKAQAAAWAGLEPIVCVGETLVERRSGKALEVVRKQVLGSLPDELRQRPFALAYEPVWAIGTDMTPTLDQIEETHVALRGAMIDRLGEAGRGAPILYGGSVNAKNASEILKAREVGGALVGRASLTAKSFLAIIRAAG